MFRVFSAIAAISLIASANSDINNCINKINKNENIKYYLINNHYSNHLKLECNVLNYNELVKKIKASTNFVLDIEKDYKFNNEIKKVILKTKDEYYSPLNEKYYKGNVNSLILNKILMQEGYSLKIDNDISFSFFLKEPIKITALLELIKNKKEVFLNIDYERKRVEFYKNRKFSFDFFAPTDIKFIANGYTQNELNKNKISIENFIENLKERKINYLLKDKKIEVLVTPDELEFVNSIYSKYKNNVILKNIKLSVLIISDIDLVNKLIDSNNIKILEESSLKISIEDYFNLLIELMSNSRKEYFEVIKKKFFNEINNESYKYDSKFIEDILNQKNVSLIKKIVKNKLYIKNSRNIEIKTKKDFLSYMRDENIIELTYDSIKFEDLLDIYIVAVEEKLKKREYEIRNKLLQINKSQVPKNFDIDFFKRDFEKKPYQTVKQIKGMLL